VRRLDGRVAGGDGASLGGRERFLALAGQLVSFHHFVSSETLGE